ncbi:hypothetical protein HJD18_06215 [Thermoleophilia bacterium SCSIO 60948]|nr:hypothetical protein HJD18_06215 [Thermoleophilia bacterium SCSIO 60948]
MPGAPKTQLHLADLHRLAAEYEVPKFRMMSRSQLVAAIEEAGGDAAVAPEVAPVEGSDAGGEEQGKGKARRAAGTRRRRRQRETTPEEEGVEVEATLEGESGSGAAETDAAGAREDEATEEISGTLEVLPQRYGFIRVGDDGGTDDADVYISAAQIRRCELRSGDEVAGPARPPRRGERHRALVHVDRVNGEEPGASERPSFDSLPAELPNRRLPLDGERSAVLTRTMDVFAPLWLGQRVLISAAARSGRTTLLRGIARAVAAAENTELVVLLIDEAPEEASAWRGAIESAEFAVSPADASPAEHVRTASVALERARRAAESGTDVVLICDSLSRLAAAAGEWAPVKRLFGSGRNLAGGGSLTVIATVLDELDEESSAERAVTSTESSLVVLDPELAAAGVYPALRIAECRISNEEELRSPEELEAVRRLRAELTSQDPAEAARIIRERIEASANNAELLASVG